MAGRHGSGARGALLLSGFALLYVGATLLGRQTRPEDSALALAWPAAGVGVWFLLSVRGRREQVLAAVAVVVATVAVNSVTAVPPVPSVVFGLVNAAHAVLGAVLVRRAMGSRPRLTTPQEVGRLLAASAATALCSGAVAAVAAASLLGEALPSAFALFTVRNGGTMFVVLAAVLAVSPPYRLADLVAPVRAPGAVLVTAASLGLFAFVFASPDRPPLLFLGMAAAVLAGTSVGVARAGALGLALSVLAVVGTVEGGGPLASVDEVIMRAVYVQLFTVLLMVVTLSLATLQRTRDELAATLAATVRRLEAAHDSALIGKAVLVRQRDGAWSVLRPNPALVTLFGHDPTGRSWQELLCPDDGAAGVAALEDIAAGRRSSWEAEVRHCRGGGEPVWTQVHVSVLPDLEGPPAVVAEIMDITARRAEQQRLEERVSQDDLTGLRNRTGLLEEVVRMLRDAGEPGVGSALLFLDLDDFKSVNDAYGHEAGDRLLVQVAGALRRAVRDGDVAARLGGDEFVVCLPGVHDRRRAEQLAGRVRQEVRRALHLDGRRLGLDVSVGVALSEPHDDAASLLRRADAAMYAAKFARRRSTDHGTSLPA